MDVLLGCCWYRTTRRLEGFYTLTRAWEVADAMSLTYLRKSFKGLDTLLFETNNFGAPPPTVGVSSFVSFRFVARILPWENIKRFLSLSLLYFVQNFIQYHLKALSPQNFIIKKLNLKGKPTQRCDLSFRHGLPDLFMDRFNQRDKSETRKRRSLIPRNDEAIFRAPNNLCWNPYTP